METVRKSSSVKPIVVWFDCMVGKFGTVVENTKPYGNRMEKQ